MEDKKVELLIRSLGIGATYRGYRYLCYGLILCMSDEDYLLSVSKLLYPQIAKEFHASNTSVERDLRTVINVCWERGNRNYLQDISLHPLNARPTSGEFMDILSSYLRRQAAG